jgi:cell division protein ZapA
VSAEAVPVVIQILDKDYTVACPPDEREGLLASARMLNERMCEVRDSGKVLGAERMAVMTALNIIHEVALERAQRERALADTNAAIRALEGKLADAIPRRAPIVEVD